MKKIYPFRWAIVLFLLGLILRISGALMKILHWINADPLLIAGAAIMVISLIWLIVQLMLIKKQSH